MGKPVSGYKAEHEMLYGLVYNHWWVRDITMCHIYRPWTLPIAISD